MPLPLTDTRARFAGDPTSGTSGAWTYAPWVDHRLFMIHVASRAAVDAREALRRGDPAAIVGTSGDHASGAAAGIDWAARGRVLDVVGRYPVSTAVELDSMGTLSLAWTGYDDPDPFIRHRVWSSLGYGEDGLALFLKPPCSIRTCRYPK